MTFRILVLTLVLQVLLVSSESTSAGGKDIPSGGQQPKNEDQVETSRISTISVRSEKTPRFFIRRARPHMVTYNIVKTPSQTFGFSNRNDNGVAVESSSSSKVSRPASVESRPNTTSSTVDELKSRAAEIQSKSDVIDYGSLNDDRFYQYKTPSLYEYNTMHSSSPYQLTQEQRVQAPKLTNDVPKLEYLHAYQFVDDAPTSNGQESEQAVDELEFNRIRSGQPQQLQSLQVHQQQEQPTVEISKSKQYSYTIRKPEQQTFNAPSSFAAHSQNVFQQPQLQQQQQPQQQGLYQTASQTFGRETAYLKQTPTVIPQQQEEFKFQRVNRPPVEKETAFDEDTKPVHIHHHYPVQHIEETEQETESQPQQQQHHQHNHHHHSHHHQQQQQQSQQSQYPSSQALHSQPVRSQFHYQSNVAGSKGLYSNLEPVEQAPTLKPFSHGYNHGHQSYITPRPKPAKQQQQQWPETNLYDAAPKPKWQNPHHSPDSQKQTQVVEEERDRPVYPNNIRIEIPEEEIYKHIQNSVHQIIRDLKDKRNKDNNRGKSLANQDQSWTKFTVQDGENKREKSNGRVSFNKTSNFDSIPAKTTERDEYSSSSLEVAEKPREQSFHQYHHQQPHFHHSSHRINNRQHDEEKPLVSSSNKFTSFRFEEGYNAPPHSTNRGIEATQYESGFPRETSPATVDITMKNPKKAPVIDLNALDVGQTWNHDSHFESQEFKNDHTHVYFNGNSRPTPSSQSPSPSTSFQQFNVHREYTSQPNSTSNSGLSSHIQSHNQIESPRNAPNRVQSNFHPDNAHTMTYVGSAINVRDQFARAATPTPAFFKASPPASSEPEVPEVDIMHGLLPVVNQFDNGNRVLKVILDPSKMPRELVTDVNPNVFQQQDLANNQLPGNVQTIQYNMNHQHLIPIVANQQYGPALKQSPHNTFVDQQQNFVVYPQKERTKEQHQVKSAYNKVAPSGWSNNIPEGSANVIQYLPPPPLPASRSLLPYDSYSPIYNEELSQGKAMFHNLEASSAIMRNKRHRGSEEFKKIIRTYPRNSKKVKTVKILEPSTEMKPPPKYNKFGKKSSVL